MAGSNMVEHKLRLLIETQLDEQQKQQVGKQLKNILGSAAIGFDEAETKKNLIPIVRMIQRLFEKADIKFDADRILGMPSQQALQEVADITADDFQRAFDRALAKSGGVKIDFGNVDLSGMTEPLERVATELTDISRKIANDTKKSVDDIDLAIKRLNKTKPKKINAKVMVDGIEEETTREISKVEQTVDAIEKTLGAVNNPKSLNTEKAAVRALEKAREKYSESVANDDPWEIQYQYMISFVSKYEAMTKKIKPIIDVNHSEFKELYDILSPKAGAAKISLEHFVDVATGNELTEYKNQPWARESTLKDIAQTLKSGISVKDDGGDDKDYNRPKEPQKSQPPVSDGGDNDKNKKINTKVPQDAGESAEAKAARLEREAAERAKREEERKRKEAERIAEIERTNAEKRRAAEEKAIAKAREVHAKEMYRVVYAPIDEEDLSRDERKAQYGGVEIWSSSSEVANTYADGQENPVMLRGSMSAKNAYIIDAGGANWNQFDKMKVLNPTGIDANGKVKFDEASLRTIFPDLFRRVDNKEFGQAEDIQAELYGMIKNLGYDAIVTKNVIDTMNPAFYSEPSTIYSVIDDKILSVLDAFAVAEQDDDGVTTFEDKPRRENIPDYYKMPEIAIDANAESIMSQKEAFKQLIDYIGKSGKTPGKFFDEILLDSKSLDGELKNILTSLKMFDSNGNLNFKSISDGFSNLGGAVTDAYTLISREKHYLPKTQDLMPKLLNAKSMGANVGEIVDVFEDKVSGRIYELQKTMPGTIIPDNTEFLEATDEQILKLIHDLEVLHKTGLYIDFGGDNILYDKEKGFSFIDLATKPQDGQETTGGMAQEFLRYTKSFFKDDSFSGFESRFANAANSIKTESTAHRQNAEAIVEETRAQQELNEAKNQSLLPTADGLEAHTYAPSDEQKEYVLKLGEEYRAIMSILERGDSEFESALIERAKAINKIMLDTIRGNDGTIEHMYKDVYGGDTKTTSALGDWRQKDRLFHNVDSDKIDDSQRQAAIDLIYQELEAEKQLEAERLKAREAAKQRELDAFKSKYSSASEEEKKLLYEIIELEKEYKRLYDIGDEESHRAAMTTLEKMREKEKQLEKMNTDLLGAYDDVGAQRAAPYVDVPRATSQEVDVTTVDTSAEQTQLTNLKGSVDNVTGAIDAKTKAFKNEGTEVSKVVDGEIAKVGELKTKIKSVSDTLAGLLNNVKTGADDVGSGLSNIVVNVNSQNDVDKDRTVSIDKESLRQTLGEVIYNVKIAHDDTDKNANKIALDEGALESTLQRVFTNILNPHTEQNDSKPNNEPWALEDTLRNKTNKLLGKIVTNTDTIKTNTKDVAKDAALKQGLNALNTKIKAAPVITGQSPVSQPVAKPTVTKSGGSLLKMYERLGALGVQKNALDLDSEERVGIQEQIRLLKEEINQKHKLVTVDKQLVAEAQKKGAADQKAKMMTVGGRKSDIQAVKDEKTAINDLLKAYERLGELRAKRDMLPNGAERDELQKEIKLETSRLWKRSSKIGIDKTRTSEAASRGEHNVQIDQLLAKTKELGTWQAKLAVADKDSADADNAREHTRRLSAEIKGIKDKIALTDDENEALRKVLQTNKDIVHTKLAEKQTRDSKEQVADAKRTAKKNAMFGKAGNAVGRAEGVWMNAQGIEDPLSANTIAQVDQLYNKFVALREAQEQLNKSENVTPEQQDALRKQTIEVNKLTNEVGGLISEYQKLSGDNIDPETIRKSTLGSGAKLSDYEQQLKNYVREVTHGQGQIKKFDATTKTLTYTVKTGRNEFTEYTAAVRRADGALVSVQGATKRAETFLEATKRKMKELTSYMSGMALFSRITQEFRKGIQYVREIDLALTELKKVTDETEKEYDQFLETAAKTGARLGTTISAVTEATATFAKLGYTMEQATEMAESAIVYKNVGDNIASTEDAADSIISTMKGFGLEASESMAIVDRFNEVGE